MVVKKGAQSLLSQNVSRSWGSRPEKVGRTGSAIVHTGNNCEDEREAEKEERMTIEVSPVESTEAIVIGAGSEFLRLKCRHDVFADTEKENRYG